MPVSASTAMDAEKELILALSLVPVNSETAARARRLIADGIDWGAFADLATQWRVEPVVYGNLRGKFASDIPPSILADFIDRERMARALALSRTMRIVELVRMLSAAGVQSVVLKGPAISMQAYGDFSRRTFSDADLLVRRADLISARNALVERGYVPEFAPDMLDSLIDGQHALELSDSAMKVELHWALLSRFLCFDLDPEDLWEGAVSIRCMETDLPVLSQPHLFLYLCAHGAKHEWALFRWICDVAQLARALTADEIAAVMALAEATNTRRILALALRLVQETFPDEMLRFPAEALRRAGETDRLASTVHSTIGITPIVPPDSVTRRMARIHPYFATLVFWTRSRERFRDRARTFADFLLERVNAKRYRVVLRPARIAADAVRRIVHST